MNKEELLYQIATLEQENKQLKGQLETYKILLKVNLERIDKAIEYINEFPSLRYSSIDITNGNRLSGKVIPTDYLLEILKGE